MGISDVIVGTRPPPALYRIPEPRNADHWPILYSTRWPELCHEVPSATDPGRRPKKAEGKSYDIGR